MTQPFLGQIQPFGFGFAPRGWALCNGQLLSISQNTALFALLGTMYGGNGITTFALPNLQSRVGMSAGTDPVGNNYSQGEEAGEETITINLNTMPLHNHAFMGTAEQSNKTQPVDNVAIANIFRAPSGTPDNYYGTGALQPLNPGSVATIGGNQPHSNLQPYLTISWCIAMQGIFPARN
jgi:microcystin-dependent protein